MTLHVQTARIGYRGKGIEWDGLDITRKSGSELGLVFAPSWDILRPALDHRKALEKLDAAALTAGQNAYIRDRVAEPMWRLYTAAFAAEMRVSWRQNRRAWDELLGRERVVLLCYCSDAERCHRRLVAEVLAKLGAIDDGEVASPSTGWSLASYNDVAEPSLRWSASGPRVPRRFSAWVRTGSSWPSKPSSVPWTCSSTMRTGSGERPRLTMSSR